MRTSSVLVLLVACASAAGSPKPAPSSVRPAAEVELEAAPGGELQLPLQGHPCMGGRCGAGLTCLSYRGVAGPSGPSSASCELPCGDKGVICPDGQVCVTISDGPGRVCRWTD